jgi:hypothetical protein
VSPRFVPATVTELSRVPLLAAVPGADLVRLAERLERIEVGPGGSVRLPGRPGNIVIVLSGLASSGRGGIVRPGEVVELADPHQALTAMTPCVAVLVDAATYDELIAPHVRR